MTLTELLAEIEKIAIDGGLSKPFIIGGVPRDRIIGAKQGADKIRDIDLTTGDAGSLKLAILIHQKHPESRYDTYDDGHASIDWAGIHFDFSSHFVIEGIEQELVRLGVKNITEMKKELFSRDFTINTLLETLDLSAIYDLTKKGVDDIKAKVIRCPIDAELTISSDPRRILRAIRFSVKYGFELASEVKLAIRNNYASIKTLPTKFVSDKVNEILALGSDDVGSVIDTMVDLKVLPMLPLTKQLSDVLIQTRKLVKAI